MATRKFTSKARRSRTPDQAEQGNEFAADTSDSSLAESTDESPRTVEGIVDHERGRLLKAKIVLDCVGFALDHAEWHAEQGSDYARAVEVAVDLLEESINRLDSTRLKEFTVHGGDEPAAP